MEIWALQNKSSDPMDMLMLAEVDERIDKKILMEEILVKCGSLFPVFNTSWSFAAWHMHWFEYNKKVIGELIDSTVLDYNPIESFSRIENNKHDTQTDVDTKENSNSGMKRKEGDTRIGNYDSVDSDDNKTSAYNEDIYQPDTRRDGTRTEQTSNVDTIEIDEGREENREYKKGTKFSSTDNNNVHGNNGLFTVQHLIEEQRKLVTFNVMDWIVKKYMKEGFLLVY